MMSFFLIYSRCANHRLTEMHFYWVHLAMEHYADAVVTPEEFEDNSETKCLFDGCPHTFGTRVAMVAHMAAAHEIMQIYFGTIIGNDLYLRTD
jgi:hypothetical protein